MVWRSVNQRCIRCSRLNTNLKQLRKQYPDYHNRPVPGCGDIDSGLLIVGLAPGLHGANKTGIPFTGDASGTELFAALQAAGINHPAQGSGDGVNCYITNAVKCLPPQNAPKPAEVSNCRDYLIKELNKNGQQNKTIVALGGVAHRAIISSLHLRQKDFAFEHGKEHRLSKHRLLIDCYHCSRLNFNTKRLTAPMLRKIFQRARQHLAQSNA